MTNQQVLSAWLLDNDARSVSLTSLDGELYSYKKRIAIKTGNTVVILNYRKSGGHFISATTSKHVTQAINACVRNAIIPHVIRP